MKDALAIPGPLFVVGLSRSGTALVRAILNRNDQIALVGETHYFDDVRIRLGGGTRPLDATGRLECEDYFLRLSHRPYGHGGTVAGARLDRAALRVRAAVLGGTADAHLRAFCELRAEEDGAAVWGEKTPRHVFRIDDIVGAFPTANVVCMVRDPRSVTLSYRDWRNQGGFDVDRDPDHVAILEHETERARRSYNLLIVSMLWRAQAQAALQAVVAHGPERIRLQRYEDLVAEPELEIEALCRFVGVAHDPEMAHVPMLNSSFSAFDAGTGVSREAVDRWRHGLSDEEVAVVQSVCATPMRRLGYELAPVRAGAGRLARHWAGLPAAGWQAVRANRDRMGAVVPYVSRRLRLLRA